MRRMKTSVVTFGLLVIATAMPVASATAQAPGACRQIRQACQDAGFIQGAFREGVGLQIHCIMPIMQARSQPPTARKPLPKVNSKLVADCKVSNPRFGKPRWQEATAQQLPGSTPAARLAYPSHNPPAASAEGDRAAPSSPAVNALRPPVPAVPEQQRALIAALPPEDQPEAGPVKDLPPQFRRTTVDYRTKEPAGTIIIDTPHTYLYLALGNGKAMRYGIGVGREGFTWSGAEKVTRMAEWPDWHPPEEMIERQPYLPRFMAGGEGNPLGARALYLGETLYRVHGTNQPSTIGTFVSSGCIRLTNEDITDLYGRVRVGTRVVVLPAQDSSAPRQRQRPRDAVAEKSSVAPPPKSPPQTSSPQASPAAASPAQNSSAKSEAVSDDTVSTTSAPAAEQVAE